MVGRQKANRNIGPKPKHSKGIEYRLQVLEGRLSAMESSIEALKIEVAELRQGQWDGDYSPLFAQPREPEKSRRGRPQRIDDETAHRWLSPICT